MPIAAASTDAARLLLFADARRASGPGLEGKVRRYRLARLRLDGARREDGEPRYAYLKRGHD